MRCISHKLKVGDIAGVFRGSPPEYLVLDKKSFYHFVNCQNDKMRTERPQGRAGEDGKRRGNGGIKPTNEAFRRYGLRNRITDNDSVGGASQPR